MKSELTQKGKASEYPCLKISKDTKVVVLFSSISAGFVVHPGESARHIGESSLSWSSHCFEPFSGEVTLSN